MLKLLPPGGSEFNNFKCGEIFCLTVSTYAATCNICDQKLDYMEFPKHFQHHLADKADALKRAEREFVSMSPLDDPIKSEDEEEFPEEKEFLDLPVDDEKLINLEDLKSNTSQAIVLNQPEPVAAATVLQQEEHLQSFEDEDKDFISSGDEWKDEEDFSSDDSVKKQEVTASELSFPCPKCDRCYKSKRSLYGHLKSKHGPNSKPKSNPFRHKCDECGELFRTEPNLRAHKYKHTGIVCDVCGRTFSQVGNLARHKIRHTGVKSHKCEECGNLFYTEKELNAHKIRHTGVMKHICEVCGRRCRDRGVLTAHMRRHTGERPAKCDVCGKSFFSFHDLNVHAVAHSDLRPFKCDICGGTFQRKKALRVHKKIHNTAAKNHICQICGKAFVMASGLTAHMRSHNATTSSNSACDADITDIVLAVMENSWGDSE